MLYPECLHNPIQCILPPHIIEAIKLRGTPAQRAMVEGLAADAATFRAEREAAAPSTAFEGAAVLTAAAISPPKIEVYDAQKKTTLPGKLARKTGAPPVVDQGVNDAFDGAAATHELYQQAFGRDSIDGHGMTLVSSVHYSQGYNNAFWNGSQMVYGDGDGTIFTPLTGSLSVIGHELSHGVVQFSGGLTYQDQSGALNESFADVFGALTVQRKKGQTAAEADWLIGDGILGPGIAGKALRSMRAPGTAYDDPILGKDPQPYHMDFYVNTSSDNGGVHINSGIPNHAFFLLAQLLGGYAWERPGKIWYDTIQAISNPFATFVDWADETVTQATKGFGSGSVEAIMTRRCWKLVGISV